MCVHTERAFISYMLECCGSADEQHWDLCGSVVYGFCVDVVSRPKSNWNATAFYVHDADQRRLAHHWRLSHGVGEKGVVGP